MTTRSLSPLARAVRMKSVSMTSIIPERVSRMIATNSNRPSAIAGRINERKPASSPPVGNQPNWTAKKKIIIRPSQKLGVACPITATKRASQSMTVPRFNAARMPSGTASASANTTPATPSLSVLTARSPIAASAGVPPPSHELPKSPCANFPRKMAYWTWSGWCSPRSSRRRSTASGRRWSGASRVASGLPTRRETKKTVVATMKTTKNAWTSRIAK